MTPEREKELIAVAISGAPFPSARSRARAAAVLGALEAAGMRIVPVKALDRLLQSAAMLQQNSEECVRRHHGFDTDLHGLPGWLRETAEDIREVRAMIEDSKEE